MQSITNTKIQKTVVRCPVSGRIYLQISLGPRPPKCPKKDLCLKLVPFYYSAHKIEKGRYFF